MDIEKFRQDALAHEKDAQRVSTNVRDRMKFFTPITNHFTRITGFTPPTLMWCEKYGPEDAFTICAAEDADFPLVIEDSYVVKGDEKIAAKWLVPTFQLTRDIETAIRNEFFEYVRDNHATMLSEVNGLISALEEALENDGVLDGAREYHQEQVLKARQRAQSVIIMKNAGDGVDADTPQARRNGS